MSEQNPFYNQPQWYPTPPTPFEQASRQGAAYVGGVLLTMSALTVGDYLHDYEQQHVLPYLKEADQPRIEQRMEPPREVRYQLGVVAISASEEDAVYTAENDTIGSTIAQSVDHIQRTLPDYNLRHTVDYNTHVASDGTEEIYNTVTGQSELKPCYTMDAVNAVLDQHGKTGRDSSDMEVAVINSKEFGVCGSDGWLGVAYTKNGQARNVIKADGITSPHVLTHEMGHVLKADRRPNTPSLMHQAEFTCFNPQDSAAPIGRADTIQNLLKYGCTVGGSFGVSKNEADVNEYSSPISAMGWKDKFEAPAYSPPEVAQLDPTRRVDRMNKPVYGHYELSYRPGERYGIEIALPKDHVVRGAFPQVLPDASHIFIGPYLLRPSEPAKPFNDQSDRTDIGVFITKGLENQSNTIVMIPDDELGDLSEDPSTPLMLYADEQMDMVIMGGVDQTTKQRYVDILPLSSEEGRQLYHQHIYPPIGKADLP